MLYKLLLDENDYLTGFVHTETSEDTFALEPSTMELDYLNCYKLVDDKLIFDEEKYDSITNEAKRIERIAELKKELAATDYKVIKCSEYIVAGLELPYSIYDLHMARQAIRDEINQLEQK